jgi:hypothetical protein
VAVSTGAEDATGVAVTVEDRIIRAVGAARSQATRNWSPAWEAVIWVGAAGATTLR